MRPRFVLSVLLVFLAHHCLCQERAQVTFHVTSVRSEDATDWCTTGKCSAKRFTVEGRIDGKDGTNAVEYLLECVEVMANEPQPHPTVICVRVHANEDYSAKLGADYVAFDTDQPLSKEGPVRSAYGIVSEKAVPRHK